MCCVLGGKNREHTSAIFLGWFRHLSVNARHS
jgi:hypothetical protein